MKTLLWAARFDGGTPFGSSFLNFLLRNSHRNVSPVITYFPAEHQLATCITNGPSEQNCTVLVNESNCVTEAGLWVVTCEIKSFQHIHLNYSSNARTRRSILAGWVIVVVGLTDLVSLGERFMVNTT